MKNRFIIGCILWIAIFTAVAMTGCGQEQISNQEQAEVQRGASAVLHDGFRIRRDAVRNRIWVLGLDSVRIYDGQSKALIREIALPNWSVARFACDPDMVLDGSGSAIISSNVQPRLWRIDAGSFEVSEHPVTLQGRERWDVGLGALAVGADGTLLALTSITEALWRIDLDKGSGSMVPSIGAPVNACGLTARSSSRTASRRDAVASFDPAAGGPGLTLERGRKP
jgi:hypothetical protein